MCTAIRHSLTAILLVVVCACDNSAPASDPLPYVYVYETVYLNEARALPIYTRNNAFIYIGGGLKGIILYRRGPADFIALERQSPAAKGCRAKVDVTQQYVIDTCSNSQFDFSGRFVSGSSGANLRQYSVNYDGAKILITN